MSFGPHILERVETALAEVFQYHNQMDDFLRRAGLPDSRLATIRQRAEDRSKAAGKFLRAPKRYIVQELLRELGTDNRDGDRLIAAIVTALCKGRFPDATGNGQAAVDDLKAQRIDESREAAERRAEADRQRRAAEQDRERSGALAAAKHERFRQDFLVLHGHQNHQQRGFALERFLNEFFDYAGLSPRGSFRIVGEQIDGSFSWAGKTHLVEAKWVEEPVAGAEFGAFVYKVGGKTADTRGLYISINGYSPHAIAGLNGKGELRFICIDGAHLLRSLEPGRSLPALLEILWRHASETGEAYLPVSSDAFLKRGG